MTDERFGGKPTLGRVLLLVAVAGGSLAITYYGVTQFTVPHQPPGQISYDVAERVRQRAGGVPTHLPKSAQARLLRDSGLDPTRWSVDEVSSFAGSVNSGRARGRILSLILWCPLLVFAVGGRLPPLVRVVAMIPFVNLILVLGLASRIARARDVRVIRKVLAVEGEGHDQPTG